MWINDGGADQGGGVHLLAAEGLSVLLVEQNAKLTVEATSTCLVMDNGAVAMTGRSTDLSSTVGSAASTSAGDGVTRSCEYRGMAGAVDVRGRPGGFSCCATTRSPMLHAG